MKNENKLDEMVDILATLHKYVPLDEIPSTTISHIKLLHKLLLGGDLLTAVRVKGAQRIRQNSDHPVGRLQGFIPVAEDWHANVCLMEVHCYLNIDCVQVTHFVTGPLTDFEMPTHWYMVVDILLRFDTNGTLY